MSKDNVLKATVESIAESDNEIGGTLITRLREAVIPGREDGRFAGGDGVLHSPADVFSAAMVGLELDCILNPAGSTGNEGRYLIGTYSNPQEVTLTTLGGAPVVFAAEDPVIWRIATLRVESVFEFLVPPTATDLVGQLWVGSESSKVTYGAVTMAPGASSFDQLGDPLTGLGYLTARQIEGSEVIDARRGYSALDKLWRAMLVAYATEEELDRIGRVLNVPRPRGISDAIYRRLLMVMPYLPRCIPWAFELVLEALYPSATPAEILAMVYEDLVNYPCAIFLLLPEVQPGTESEGRTLFNAHDAVTSTAATAVTAANTPITVESVVTAPVSQDLDVAVLPSANTPAWTYVNEGLAEGAAFSAVTAGYQQVSGAGTPDSGRYKRAAPGIDRDFYEVSAWWQPDDLTASAGWPWHLMVCDGEREIALLWRPTGLQLGQLDGTAVSAVSAATLAVGVWHNFRLRRCGDYVWGFLDGADLWGPVLASSFAASSAREVGFGYVDNALNQNWRVFWGGVGFAARSTRNYWNINRADGVFVGSPDVILASAAGLFLATDTGLLVRTRSTLNLNDGLWRATYVSPTELSLGPVLRRAETLEGGPPAVLSGGAAVSGTGTSALVVLSDPWLRPIDVTKTLTIADSDAGNDGDVEVLEVLDAWTARVNKPGGFTAEQHLTWSFKPVFAAEASIAWELVGAGSRAGAALTLRDDLPDANTPVEVTYTDVLSAQVVRDEFVRNNGSGGGANHVYYPAYLLDVSSSIRQLLSDITAAGVIPYYQRPH